MSRHRSRNGASSSFPALVLGSVAVLVLALVFAVTAYSRSGNDVADPPRAAVHSCATTVRVVTAASFAPVFESLAPDLAGGDQCLRAEVTVADGRAAAERVAATDADVWIPDDASWPGTGAPAKLAPKDTLGTGTVLATSPIFMVTDKPTAERINQAGGSWLALAKLVGQTPDVRLAVREPNGSGDGMVAAGAVGEGVWLAEGMDASSLALNGVKLKTRTVAGAGPALPENPGEVGLVPEYALLPVMPADAAYLAGADGAAMLRYTWLPTAAAAADTVRAANLRRLLDALRGADRALAAARLRGPGAEPLAASQADRLPKLTAKPFGVMSGHKVDHVFITWYPSDRQVRLLMFIDVSGSMKDPAAGSKRPVIDLIRDGCRAVEQLLPDESRLGLWEFGHDLAPPNDFRPVLPPAPLAAGHRQAWNAAVNSLAAQRTGTGLYDTILGAYLTARDSYEPGVPNHVFVFTDGRNEDDPGSITIEQLTERLGAAKDPKRPVELSVVAYAQKEQAEALKAAVKPVSGYVDAPQTAAEVGAVFIHTAAGGVHGH